MLRTTMEGQELIKGDEGCDLIAYQDGGGVLTIGWGHTGGVKMGDQCTQEQADAWFTQDLTTIEAILTRLLNGVVVSDNQFSALASFCYNVGFGRKGAKDGFAILKTGEPSTMLRCVLARDFAAAAAEFPKWNHVDGVESAGLIKRRAQEVALFTKEG